METIARIPKLLLSEMGSINTQVKLNQDYRNLRVDPSDRYLSNEDTLNSIIESLDSLRARLTRMLGEARVEDIGRGVKTLAEREAERKVVALLDELEEEAVGII